MAKSIRIRQGFARDFGAGGKDHPSEKHLRRDVYRGSDLAPLQPQRLKV
jgi:hypothetical protein